MNIAVKLPPQYSSPGFTLVEVMVVVSIIGILSAVAIPSYQRYITRSKLPEAFSMLAGMGMSAQQYYQDNRTYVATDGSDCPFTKPSSKNFEFKCSNASATSLLMTATGSAPDLKVGRAITFTLDHDGKRNTPSVPTGWTSNTNACWVRSQSGDC